MTWERGTEPLAAGREANLRFRVADPSGAPAALQPYMGMMSHAAVSRDDGSVFVHLHPAGSVSATAQQLFAQREAGDTTRTAEGALVLGRRGARDCTAPASRARVSFPYEFPRPGATACGGRSGATDACYGPFDADVR